MLKEFTSGQLNWSKINNFGNGKIIEEQLTNNDNLLKSDESLTIDSMLFFEFLLVIRQISRLVSMLKSQFVTCKIDMENIGQLLRFNIQSDDVSCGSLFNCLDSNKSYLMIN